MISVVLIYVATPIVGTHLNSILCSHFSVLKDELRKELGMDEDLPAVLLMGGGEGMGPIEATARALGDSLYDENLGEPVGQVLVICGRNKKLASKLLAIDWKIPVQVFESSGHIYRLPQSSKL